MTTTIHAAYKIGEDRHVTIFYNDRCDENTLFELIAHLQSLPSGRLIIIKEFVELDNPKQPSNPLIGAKLLIMNEEGTTPDYVLMDQIAMFSDKYSWRSNLTIDSQYKFTLHTTLGLKSEVDVSQYVDMKFITSIKYIKNHSSNKKLLFE